MPSRLKDWRNYPAAGELESRLSEGWGLSDEATTSVAYPSLLDPTSPSRTFATTDRRPYLYFTLFNHAGCKLGLDRDLVRVPVELAR